MDISNNLDEMTLRLMSNKKGLTSYLKQNNKEEYEKIKYLQLNNYKNIEEGTVGRTTGPDATGCDAGNNTK